jgi:hypothetical protein
MADLITSEAAAVLLQVIMIDLVLAGDNAIVIGLAAAGLPLAQRRRDRHAWHPGRHARATPAPSSRRSISSARRP